METGPTKKIKLDNKLEESIEIHSTKHHVKDVWKPTFDSGSSDFSKIVASDGFVDKTLLIKELFETTCKVLITAPRRFGKSTNLDMVKRFLEIDVDYSGKLMNTSTSANYKLFSENKLKIFDHDQFCKQHLGKHPVMIIDFKPLAEVDSFESMISSYSFILRKTFEHHRYLLEVSQLWTGKLKIDRFKSYIDPDNSKNVDVFELKCGFNFLAEVLHKYFGKPVFLLIDEYDCYFNSFLFNDIPDMGRIINFVQSATADLLKSSNHIDHALLTGVLRLSNDGLSLTFSQCLGSINHCKFLYKHSFCAYFGMTNRELSSFVKKMSKGEKDQEKCFKTLDKYYNGYEIINKKIKIYSIWSIIDFFDNRKKVRRNCDRDDFIFRVKSVFRVNEISDKILRLLLGKYVEVDISKQISKRDISIFSDLMKSIEYKTGIDDMLFVILYHMGYLSVAEMKQEASLKIPNQEVFFQFAKLLKESYELKYNFNPKNIEKFHSDVNSLRKSQLNDEKLSNFCETCNELFFDSSWEPHKKNDLVSILFIFLTCKFSFMKSRGFNGTLDNFHDFVTVNDHDVALLIQAKVEEQGSKEILSDIATGAYNQLIDRNLDSVLQSMKNKLRGRVYLGICCSMNKKFMFAYSIMLNDDGSPPLIPKTTS